MRRPTWRPLLISLLALLAGVWVFQTRLVTVAIPDRLAEPADIGCWRPRTPFEDPEHHVYAGNEHARERAARSTVDDLDVVLCQRPESTVLEVLVTNRTCSARARSFAALYRGTAPTPPERHKFVHGVAWNASAAGPDFSDLLRLQHEGPAYFRVRIAGPGLQVGHGGWQPFDPADPVSDCRYRYHIDVVLAGDYHLEVLLIYTAYNALRWMHVHDQIRPLVGRWVVWTHVNLHGRYDDRAALLDHLAREKSAGRLPQCHQLIRPAVEAAAANTSLATGPQGLWTFRTRDIWSPADAENTHPIWTLFRSSIVRFNHSVQYAAPSYYDQEGEPQGAEGPVATKSRQVVTLDVLENTKALREAVSFEYTNCYLRPVTASDLAACMTADQRLVVFEGDSHMRSLYNVVAEIAGIRKHVCTKGWETKFMSCHLIFENVDGQGKPDPIVARLAEPDLTVVVNNRTRVTATFADINTTISRMLDGPFRLRYVWNPFGHLVDVWPYVPKTCPSAVYTAPEPPAVRDWTAAMAADLKRECPGGGGVNATFFNIGQHTINYTPNLSNLLNYVRPAVASLGGLHVAADANRDRTAAPQRPLIWLDTQYTSLLSYGPRYSGDSRTHSRTDLFNRAVRRLLAREFSEMRWQVIPTNMFLEAVSDVTEDGAHFPSVLLRPLAELVMTIACQSGPAGSPG